MFAVGESVALVRALRVVLLGKHKSRPTWDKLLVVMILESLHVTGKLELHFVVQGVPTVGVVGYVDLNFECPTVCIMLQGDHSGCVDTKTNFRVLV